MRNNLIDRGYYIGEELVASWGHFVKMDSAKPTSLRLAPKVGKVTHVHPNSFKRMKVKYASQVFSITASSALTTYAIAPDNKMPSEALKTASFSRRWTICSTVSIPFHRETRSH